MGCAVAKALANANATSEPIIYAMRCLHCFGALLWIRRDFVVGTCSKTREACWSAVSKHLWVSERSLAHCNQGNATRCAAIKCYNKSGPRALGRPKLFTVCGVGPVSARCGGCEGVSWLAAVSGCFGGFPRAALWLKILAKANATSEFMSDEREETKFFSKSAPLARNRSKLCIPFGFGMVSARCFGFEVVSWFATISGGPVDFLWFRALRREFCM